MTAADTVWVLFATALVMLMTPGLAFFYGGLVRRKNILSILMQCFMILCLISLQWLFFGYSLSFGPDISGFVGNLDWAGLKGVGMEAAPYAPKIPHTAFVLFQMMFAVITPALIIGAFAERIRFSALCVFSVLWATVVYDPVAHWVWGKGGFLGTQGGMGALDFAGGIVVHVNAGMAALAAVLVLGKRIGYPSRISPPHNLPFAVLGAGLLWFGWFGFNAGSALAADNIAVSAFLATHAAGAVAGLTWSILDWIRFGKPTTLGMITGAVAGLAAVTPGAGYVNLTGALWIGSGSGVICWMAVTAVKAKYDYDDSLDAFGVHGIGGLWGSLAVGLFATTQVNPAGANGLFYGNPHLLLIQAKAVLVCSAYAFVASWAVFRLVDLVIPLRVTEHEERVGLDLTQHREAGYTVLH
ncbi:MAG: ammonia channel protein [Lentisphaerae bacterium RIFOXYB12_FULL_65_16]|nr:MAG: ammonia channel protein [Lentisphaerae bacterium RIFOXYA12_64_32]OGV94099.1 MAG: ammonia channel protein [Lentisphaerae bacterium RIFOXYB12_FULL_65_16]